MAPLETLFAVRTQLSSLFSTEVYYRVVETSFFALVVYLALTRAYRPWKKGDTSDVVGDSARLAEWVPEPLASELGAQFVGDMGIDVELESAAGASCVVNGVAGVVNLASINFLGLIGNEQVAKVCEAVMEKYGCGACGPRGFYGTTDVHLECEAALAAFSGTDSAILYSFGAATGSSTIPAFCKRGDVVVVDDALNFTLETGVSLSRAEVRRFRHNDMEDLESVLADVTMLDAKDRTKKLSQRRFIIVEGIYQNVGDVAPLDMIVALKEKFQFRLILDESFSLGVLGDSGKGSLEHFNIPREKVEIATADLANSIATVGGYCVGDREVVSHQRLSGAGYCFSASQPPFLAAAATASLDIITKRGVELAAGLRENIETFRNAFAVNALPETSAWFVDGDARSPLMHIRCRDNRVTGATLSAVQKACLVRGVLLARPAYVAGEVKQPKPSLRVCISVAHTAEQLRNAAATIRDELLACSQ